MRRTLLTLAIAVILAGVVANAHHSFAAYYFEDQSTTLQGEVQEFQLRSPHALLLFKVKTTAGQLETYTAEWANPRRLGSAGVTKDTLKPGEMVIVTGSPGRDPAERKVHLKGIRRLADGWSYGTGTARRGTR
jgi:Family of unknown function (DUF6152)